MINQSALKLKSKSKSNTRRKKKQSSNQNGNRDCDNKTSTIYSQNVHGIFESSKDMNGDPIPGKRSYAKIDFIVKKMEKDSIDAYLLQETWDENDWIRERNDGYTVFHHNDNEKKSRTGVAIV